MPSGTGANRRKDMRLDRNINDDGKGKYALILMREIPGNPTTPEELAQAIVENPQCIDFGSRGSDSEYFLIRLKDKYAPAALNAYAEAAKDDDNEEWGFQVQGMAHRAEKHPGKKTPD